MLDGLGIDDDAREALNSALAARNFVEWRRSPREALPDGPGRRVCCVELPVAARGPRAAGADRARGAVRGPACERLSRVLELLAAHGAGDAVILDLGVLRDWPYYSGVVVEAYAPGVGAPIAVGGRYDDLVARFGRARPAVGFAITLDLLHQALIAADGAPAPPRPGVVLVGALDDDLGGAAAVRAAGVAVIAIADAGRRPEALAAADGWRWVARRRARRGTPCSTGRPASRASTRGWRRRWRRGPEDLRAPGALFEGAVEVLEGAGVDVAPAARRGPPPDRREPDGHHLHHDAPERRPDLRRERARPTSASWARTCCGSRSPDVYELLDLRFGDCRMVYATQAGEDPTPGALEHLGVVRVATKYPISATGYFTATGRQAEVVKVNGSVELAPLVGLAHGIVDLVATGRTLRENGLVEREEIFDSSARLIANRVSQTLRAEELDGLVQRMAQARR